MLIRKAAGKHLVWPPGVLLRSKINPVVFFFALVFALSIPFWVLGQIVPFQLLPGLPISALAAIIPALAALILVYKSNRLPGVLQLLRRSFDFKRVKDRRWYLAYILINPAIAVLAFITIRAGSKALPNPAPLTLAIFPMFIIFFIAGLGEELGWSGYATEPLAQRWDTLTAGILLGLVWAAWHFIPLLQANRSLEWIEWWSLCTLSLRLIMVWLHISSGKSVFAAALFHAMINMCWQLFPINGSYYDPRVFSLITFGFAITVFSAQRLLRKGELQAA